MHPHNDLNGQNHILAVYGLGKRTWSPRSIIGHLQHDWDAVEPCAVDLALPDGLTSFVWGASSLRRRTHSGRHNQVAIGAPWLYLMELDQDLLLPEPARSSDELHGEVNAPEAPEPLGTVVFVEHGFEGKHLARRLVREVQQTVNHEPVTVALDTTDFAVTEIRQAYVDAGLAVHNLGVRRDFPGTDEPRYLFRLLTLLRRHESVLSNSVRAELLYAGSLGMPAALLDVVADNRCLRLDLLPPRTVPGHPIPDLSAFADAELGRDNVLSPADLNRTLEWNNHA